MGTWNESREQGLTLIGVVIATTILVGSIVAISQLMVRSVQTSGLSQEKFVAANLAREGLELAQARRDSNWFTTPAVWWTDGLCPDAASTGAYTLTIEPGLGQGTSGVFTNQTQPLKSALFMTPTKQWTHIVTGTTTPYHRTLMVECAKQKAAAGITTPEQIDVTARVTWTTKGQPQVLDIKETLFNWHPLPAQSGVGACSLTNPTFAVLDDNNDQIVDKNEATTVTQQVIDILNASGGAACTVSVTCPDKFDLDSNGSIEPLDVVKLINLVTTCFP